MKKIKESTVILYGQKTDPEVKASAARLRKQGRKVKVELRPAFDTGIGACGNHLCHCKEVCQEKYAQQAQRRTVKDSITEAANRCVDIGQIFGVDKKSFQL